MPRIFLIFTLFLFAQAQAAEAGSCVLDPPLDDPALTAHQMKGICDLERTEPYKVSVLSGDVNGIRRAIVIAGEVHFVGDDALSSQFKFQGFEAVDMDRDWREFLRFQTPEDLIAFGALKLFMEPAAKIGSLIPGAKAPTDRMMLDSVAFIPNGTMYVRGNPIEFVDPSVKSAPISIQPVSSFFARYILPMSKIGSNGRNGPKIRIPTNITLVRNGNDVGVPVKSIQDPTTFSRMIPPETYNGLPISVGLEYGSIRPYEKDCVKRFGESQCDFLYVLRNMRMAKNVVDRVFRPFPEARQVLVAVGKGHVPFLALRLKNDHSFMIHHLIVDGESHEFLTNQQN